jgi:predicted ATPase
MLSPQRQRQKTLETLVAILLELADRQPVLFILEDLHWTDPTTLELLNLVIEQIPTTSILMVLTCRPHFQPAWHHRSYITEMTLNHLSHAQVAQIVTGMANGKTLPQEVLVQIVEKTDGVPLFVEELTKAILESGQLTAVDGHYELTGSFATCAIPATLQDSLMARLDRLVTAKAVAQYAAVIGRQFPYDLLQAVSQLDEATLQRELGRLVEAELVYQRGLPPQSSYVFKHALIQDAAHTSLLKSTRQHYHQRIAQVLEAQFPETAETQPELLAHHYTEAGLSGQAVGYWQKAGQRTLQRSANAEAIAHLTKGLELLRTLPDTPERTQLELVLQTTLGPALLAAKGSGAPEMERAYARAFALCRQGGETPQLFPVMRGLWRFSCTRAELHTARELAEQLLALAQRLQERDLLLQAHHAQGLTLFYGGALAQARAHLEQSTTLYDPQQHRSHAFRYGYDPAVASRIYGALTLWLLGYPDQALASSHAALTLAQAQAHPFSLAYALHFATMLHACRREGQTVQERAEATMTLATEQRFPLWTAGGMIVRSWVQVVRCPAPGAGQAAREITHMHQGLAAWRATGAEVFRSHYLALLAEAYGKAGQAAQGVTTLAEALAVVEGTGERWWEAELHRLRGELLWQYPEARPEEVEACFQQALDIARRQEAKSAGVARRYEPGAPLAAAGQAPRSP